MCNITLRYISGSGCYIIEDLGLSVSSSEENLVSNLFSVQSLVESQDLNSAILNGDIEAKANSQIVQNASQLCSPAGSGGGNLIDSWSHNFDIRGTITLNEILFNKTPIIITRNCSLSYISKYSEEINPDWELLVLKSLDNGVTWSEVFLNDNIVKDTLLKLKLVKGLNSVVNPKAVIEFQSQSSLYDTWERASSLNGNVEVSKVDFETIFIHKSCSIIQLTGRGSTDWLLEILSSTNQGTSWVVVSSLDVNTFSSTNTNLPVFAGNLVKARFVRKIDSVFNPQVSITFGLT